MTTPLAEQQKVIRQALDILAQRGGAGAMDEHLAQSLNYALIDHDDPDTGCLKAPGAECIAVVTAREIIAGEL